MAIYEYKCSECGHQFEKIQKMSDPKLTICPECGKESLEKLMSTNTGFVLFGTGWHKNGMSASRRGN